MHYLMNLNIPVLEIETCKILDEKYLPLELQIGTLKTRDILKFLQHRVASDTRENINEIYGCYSLQVGDYEKILYKSHGVSINDSYWIKEENEQLRFVDVNPANLKGYAWRAGEVTVSASAFKGDKIRLSDFKDLNRLTSPEVTLQGNNRKGIFDFGTARYILKWIGIERANNEIITYRLAKMIGLNTVEYMDEKPNDLYRPNVEYTITRVLSNKHNHWISAFNISEHMKYKYGMTPQEFALKHFKDQYLRMIILDGLVLNSDRHMRNWSFLVDWESNSIIGLTPCYDYDKAFTADSKTMSNLIFDESGKKVNILRAAKLAYSTLEKPIYLERVLKAIGKTNEYYNIRCKTGPFSNIGTPINKEALKNRILYITGQKDNQRDCY